jgi:excisionase family DNA binding protein
MQVLLDDLKRSVSAVPLSHVPIALGVLGALMAELQLRMIRGGPEPVAREGEGLLTVPEVAQRLKMSAYRIYELCRTGALQSHKCGKSVRVTPSAVVDYLAKQGA